MFTSRTRPDHAARARDTTLQPNRNMQQYPYEVRTHRQENPLCRERCCGRLVDVCREQRERMWHEIDSPDNWRKLSAYLSDFEKMSPHPSVRNSHSPGPVACQLLCSETPTRSPAAERALRCPQWGSCHLTSRGDAVAETSLLRIRRPQPR